MKNTQRENTFDGTIFRVYIVKPPLPPAPSEVPQNTHEKSPLFEIDKLIIHYLNVKILNLILTHYSNKTLGYFITVSLIRSVSLTGYETFRSLNT